jgi:uroporphyrinogen-III synthase
LTGVIVVTRTEPGASEQASALRAAGFQVDVCPVLRIECCEPSRAIPMPDIVFFMSVHAVRCGLSHVRAHLAGAQCYAVGRATADALDTEGIASRTPEKDQSTEGLLALAELEQIEGAQVVIVRGEGGREKLAEVLESRGGRVESVDVYRRVASRPKMRDLKDIDTVVIGSGDGVRALAQLVAMDARADVRLVVPSSRVAEAARALGFAKLSISDGASNEAVVSCLESRDRNG